MDLRIAQAQSFQGSDLGPLGFGIGAALELIFGVVGLGNAGCLGLGIYGLGFWGSGSLGLWAHRVLGLQQYVLLSPAARGPKPTARNQGSTAQTLNCKTVIIDSNSKIEVRRIVLLLLVIESNNHRMNDDNKNKDNK